MNAGTLSKRVVLQNPTNATDGDGGFTASWSALSPSPVWASVTPQAASAAEHVGQGTVQATTTHVVELRYHSGVTTKTRITLGGRYLYVRGVENVNEQAHTTRLLCEEVTP